MGLAGWDTHVFTRTRSLQDACLALACAHTACVAQKGATKVRCALTMIHSHALSARQQYHHASKACKPTLRAPKPSLCSAWCLAHVSRKRRISPHMPPCLPGAPRMIASASRTACRHSSGNHAYCARLLLMLMGPCISLITVCDRADQVAS